MANVQLCVFSFFTYPISLSAAATLSLSYIFSAEKNVEAVENAICGHRDFFLAVLSLTGAV